MTYDFNQHLGQSKSLGIKAFFINAADRRVVDMTDELVSQEFKTKSWFLQKGEHAFSEVLTPEALDLMAGFLSTDKDHMGSRADGPMIITVDTSKNKYPHGWSLPSLPTLVHGNGVIYLDYAYLRAGLKSLGKELSDLGKDENFDPVKSVGFYREQDVGGNKVAIQPDMRCMAWMIGHGMHKLDGMEAKIIKTAGDPWKDDMSKAIDERAVIDVTDDLKKTFKDHG